MNNFNGLDMGLGYRTPKHARSAQKISMVKKERVVWPQKERVQLVRVTWDRVERYPLPLRSRPEPYSRWQISPVPVRSNIYG